MEAITMDVRESIKGVVLEKTGKEVPLLTDSYNVSKDTKLYVFGEDEVHTLIDGVGYFQIIVNPAKNDKTTIIGHLSELTSDN